MEDESGEKIIMIIMFIFFLIIFCLLYNNII